MNAPSSPHRQRGAASVGIAMLLMFILAAAVLAVLNMSGSSVIDAAKNEEQVAALFLAESGLERARGILQTNPATQCNSTAFPSSAFNVGRGSFTYAAPAYTTTGCPGTTSTSCCSVEVTGNIGSSSRTLRLDIAITAGSGGVSGVGGNTDSTCTIGSFISTLVTNPINATAKVLSVLGYNQHYPPGAPMSSRNCTPLAPTIVLNSQNFESQGNRTLVGVHADSYNINASETIPILQGLNINGGPYSLVSVIFPQLSGATLKEENTYWRDNKNLGGSRPPNTGTEQVGSTTGSTSSGVANNTDVCDPPPCTLSACPPSPDLGVFPNSFHGSEQSCHSWCYGGDTLVLTLAHGGLSYTSNVPQGGVTFNTAGTPAQNISMTRQVHLNSTDNNDKSVYSEIWYAYNPNLSDVTAGNFIVGRSYVIKTIGTTDFTLIGAASNTVGITFIATGAGSGTGTCGTSPIALASSYKGNGTGAIGAKWTGGSNTTCTAAGTGNCVTVAQSNWNGSGNFTTAGSNILTVGTAVSSSPIYPGATITHTGGGGLNGSPYITRQLTSTEAGNALGGRGTYELSVTQTAATSAGNWTAYNSILTVGTFAGVAGAYPQQIITPQITQNALAPTITSGVGDAVTSTGGTTPQITNVTIASQLTSNEIGGMASGGLGGRGTYSLISSGAGYTVSVSSSRMWATTSNILNVSDCIICFIENGDPVYGLIANKTIGSQYETGALLPGDVGTRKAEVLQGVGRYVLISSGAPALPITVASAATLRAGTPGATIYQPSTQSMPTVTTPNTRIAIFSGNGVFAANTTVTAVTSPAPNAATNSFTVSPAPMTALDTATICGGTCAFFNDPSSISSTTTFTVDTGNTTENANTHWAGGFTCLSGVDSTKITTAVGSSTPTAANWHEVVK